MHTRLDVAQAEAGSGIPWPRLALTAWLAWWTLRLATGTTWIFLDFVDLAFHEAGHLFLSFAGSTVHYLGGTLGQLLVPSLLLYHFLVRQRRPLGAAFCAWWFGQNLINVSVYMADARELALPLVGGGDHDWNELFFRWGLLGQDSVQRVAGATWLFGLLFMVVGLAWCAYFALPASKRESVHDRVTARHAWLSAALDP